MSGGAPLSWGTAQEVRDHNRTLDRELFALVDSVPAGRLDVGPVGEWTLAENLGHIAEFAHYFAVQLRAWIRGEQVVIGRVAEHDPLRNDAIVRAPGRRLVDLTAELRSACQALDETLAELEDHHLHAVTTNVKYGAEPLAKYLDRYVVGHKAAHVRQLREALEAAGVKAPRKDDQGSD